MSTKYGELLHKTIDKLIQSTLALVSKRVEFIYKYTKFDSFISHFVMPLAAFHYVNSSLDVVYKQRVLVKTVSNYEQNARL